MIKLHRESAGNYVSECGRFVISQIPRSEGAAAGGGMWYWRGATEPAHDWYPTLREARAALEDLLAHPEAYGWTREDFERVYGSC